MVPASCGAPANFAEAVWCNGRPPRPDRELPVIRAALFRMRSIGGVCALLAQTVGAMLGKDRVRLFDAGERPGVGGLSPVGVGEQGYLALSRDLITTYSDAAHRSGNTDSRGVARPETLQLVLAHEADHLLGAGHVDPDGYLTPNTLVCSDIPVALDGARRTAHGFSAPAPTETPPNLP